MEIYKDLKNPDNQQFEKLLNSQLSKVNIEEGKIIEGKVNKVTEKYVFLHVDNFLQIYVYLSVVKLEVLPIVLDAMHMFLSAPFPHVSFLFERREPHNHVNLDREGLALRSIATDNLPSDCDNRIPCV